MDRSTALDVWSTLEQAKATDYEGDPPIYDVRLDARSGREDPPLLSSRDPAMSRYYVLRVTTARSYVLEPDDLMYVGELAREHNLSVEIENNGISLS